MSENVVELESPEELSYGPDGLLPVIVQDAMTKDVLMLAYADAEAVRRTIDTRTTWFWSRSRRTYWNKGASSGNTQAVVEIRYDCDADALLVLVDPAGPACHTGQRSCFFRSLDDQRDPRSDRLDDQRDPRSDRLDDQRDPRSDRLDDRAN